MSTFPRCSDQYYGVDYATRGREGIPAGELPAQFIPTGDYPADDLSWYANIPVPTSPLRFERIISLQESTVHLEYSLQNLSSSPRPWLYAFHALF